MSLEIISASAGTGKTYELINRIFKFKNGEEPTVKSEEMIENLKKTLFLSFSNAAVDELKRRIFLNINKVLEKEGKKLDSEILSSVQVKTIHQFAIEIIQLYRFDIGLNDDLEMIEDEELWKECVDRFFNRKFTVSELSKILQAEKIKEEDIKKFIYLTDKKHFKKSIIRKGAEIYYLLNLGMSFNSVNDNFDYDKSILSNEDEKEFKLFAEIINSETFYKITAKIISEIGDDFLYTQERLGYYTFDTVVFKLVKEIKRDKNKFIQKMKEEGYNFTNIFFDESQDNSIIQNMLISFLHNAKYDEQNEYHIVAVGDLKQSIYAFRNAMPEYMKKMIEEYKNTGRQISALNTSRRLENEKLLDDINKVCEEIQKNLNWSYYNNNEKLEKWDNKINKDITDRLKIITTNGNIITDNIIEKESFSGKIGIITYGRGYLKDGDFLKNIQAKNPFIPINIRFEQKIEDIRRDDQYSQTILPEIDTIKIIKEIINKTPDSLRYLFFTYQGNRITERLVDSTFYDKDLSGKIDYIKREFYPTSLMDNKIKDSFYTFTENIYHNLNYYDIWSFLYHKEIDPVLFGDKNSVIRSINHILYCLYSKEMNKKIHFPENIDTFDFEDLSLPPLNIFMGKNTEKTIIEVNTIHSSKGLEYDCVIALLPLYSYNNEQKVKNNNKQKVNKNKRNLLDPEYYINFNKCFFGEEYSDFFFININQDILSDRPKITVNYFPFYDVKGILRRKFENNKQIPFFVNIRQKILNDELNKLYVAITRAKKKMVIVTDAVPEYLMEYKAGYSLNKNLGQISIYPYTFIEMSKSQESKIDYPYIVQMKNFALKLNRLINKYHIPNYKQIGITENIKRMKEGTAIHLIIQSMLKSDAAIPVEFKDIIENNEEVIKEISKNNKDFIIELPIWSYKIYDNRTIYLKGSVDCVGISNNSDINLYEIKIVFEKDKEERIEEDAKKQLSIYFEVVKKLNSNTVNPIPILIKAYKKEEK